MELVPGFMLLLQGLSATHGCSHFCQFHDGADRLDLCQPAYGDSDDPGSRRHGQQILFVVSPLVQHSPLVARRLGLALFDLIQPFLGSVVMLGLDDTLAHKRGLKMFGAGMHHDPLLSSRGKVITNWGHSWVVLGVIVELPFRRGHYYFLPILFRLYLNQKSAMNIVGPPAPVQSWRWRCSSCCAIIGKTSVFMRWPIVPTAAKACSAACRRIAI